MWADLIRTPILSFTTTIFKKASSPHKNVADPPVPQNILDIEYDNLTPGMQQYQEVKKAHPDCLVMLRMGDFYEMFYQDAITAAKELEITLTSRGKGDKRAPLAGLPFHAVEPYLGKLVKRGYKVAIVEQLEDPKLAKGLVKRGLVRIVTPGTVIESSLLTEQENNFIAAITSFGDTYALSLADISTGEFSTITLNTTQAVLSELIRNNPSECLIPTSLAVNKELLQKIKATGIFLNQIEDYFFKPDKAKQVLLTHFHLTTLESFGLEEHPLNIAVSGALLRYLLDTQKNALTHLKHIRYRQSEHTMLLDANTFRNLELIKNIRDGSSRGTLLSILDKTNTPLGARMLRRWLKTPLLHISVIESRLDAIETLNQNIIAREELITLLKQVYDLERLISRINYGNATPRDVLSLKQSLQQIPKITEIITPLATPLLQLLIHVPNLTPLTEHLENAIRPDAPITLREAGIINAGYHPELDQLNLIKNNSKQYLQSLEEQERSRTGINTLKIGYTNVFGYFIEVTRKNTNLVPSHYIRKQTTVNTERYITEELKIEEEKILSAQEKSIQLEYTLFQEIIGQIKTQTNHIQDIANHLAILDVLCSLSTIAQQQNYCRPQFLTESQLHLKKSRHPVVEQIEKNFIPNDLFLESGEMIIITGPNMAGKSTIMRQSALIVLMAQIGSYVPAQSAQLGIVDRIFTRVGAYDDLSSGQSTFMIEMAETAYILNHATQNSLIILDEIGRGTSTFDGVSLAWSIAEHIYHHIKAKTLFATHYHVMNKLAEKCPKIKNYNVAIKETNDEIIFLHKLIPGGTDESYGIYVAKLAGIPTVVLNRAHEIQTYLEKDDDMTKKLKVKSLPEQKSLGEF